MSDEFSTRIRESPAGGSRIGFSYLGAVVTVVVAGLVFAVLNSVFDPLGDGAGDPNALAWTIVGVMAGAVAGSALSGWVLRLGWEWALVMDAVVLSAPLWTAWLPGAWLWAPLVVLPLVAALATLSGPRRRPWRPWVIGLACAAVIAAAVVVTFG
ncbi:hypothetical protein [Nigerium massiliense]|uniref:hypothetical protein n=1 Tax=Nigerium massiliense TaxID=1522317 RepID=UPI00058D41E9|nr:hypothetical protein [Nigerium massiliense]